jgi:uncharacterized protein YcfJ
MTLTKSIVALTFAAGLCASAAPALAGPQGRDTTYGAASGALAGGLISHSVGGAVVGGVAGGLIGNAVGRHDAHRHRYYSHNRRGYYHR